MRSCRLLTGLLAVTLTWLTGGAIAQPKKKVKRSPTSTPALATQAKPLKQRKAKVQLQADEGAPTKTRARRARAKSAKGKPKHDPDIYPPMKLEAVNGGERATLRLYDRRGRTVKPTVRKMWSMMKCHLTGKQRPIHWRLIRSMYRISRRYAGKTIYIYSGYRARRVASLPNSNHVKGRALDLRVEGVSNKALRDFLMVTFKPAGIGYYPNGPFVHFDVREKQSAFWVDSSGKGEAAEYAANPYDVLRAEREAARKAKVAKTAKVARPARPSLSRAEAGVPSSRPVEPAAAKKIDEGKARKATTSKDAAEGEPESDAKETDRGVSNTEEEPTAEAATRSKDDGAAQ
jgi:uncharacterized protein YcbK (DUF882 family)